MLSSQALETLIGLTLMLSVVALAASTIVEGLAAVTRRRGKELERALDRLLGGPGGEEDAGAETSATDDGGGSPARVKRRIHDTTLVQSLESRPGRFPSYMSADTFVDAVTEMIQSGNLPWRIEARLDPVARQVGADLPSMRAALERYFDEGMDRVSGAYKRWTTLWLFLVGLVIAVSANVSVFHAAQALWNDTPTRQAVVEAAQRVGEEGLDAAELESVAATVEQLEETALPIGWTERAQADWGGPAELSWRRLGMIGGWLFTAALVTLGAPFWFDLLQRLVALRASGAKPEKGERKAAGEARAALPREEVPWTALDAGTGEVAPGDPRDAIRRAFGASS